MSSVQGKVAVVTGAGSGIGRQLAFELARRGARLAVSDVDEAGLAATTARAEALGAQVHSTRLDVTDRDAVVDHAAAVAGHFGVVHQVYNNAGVAGGGPVLDSDWADYDRILGVNLFGVLHGTKAFLPHLIASGDGHVVNVSSLNGIMAQASINAYSASKFAVRGFTEALRAEMLLAGHPVQVSVVHPGGVRTNIATAAFEHSRADGQVTPEDEARMRVYNEKLLRMPAEQAARIVVDGVEAGKPRILVGNDAKAVDLLVRLFPATYPRIAARLQRRASPS
ncbi:SDR family NAD(P)-dependent oxidoreductase [Modestobacter italicus]|uniref:SDR family NAD(P)-dependent oxidoreductase n=1 Tax=Modestobacter italicus (strain DSM 44449 / CECT 9708 / BC 501) TaxID=2732864 RepID=UPI001C978449|nr:SDR family NAD(P)-dependent oxidoreductase [Modestobacter italicus]